MNQVFQASPVRSDSYKPWIRALGLLCSLQISSWFPAYNFTFKARGLETFPVSPAPTGSQSRAWLAELHPQAVALLKKIKSLAPWKHHQCSPLLCRFHCKTWIWRYEMLPWVSAVQKSMWVTSMLFQKVSSSSISASSFWIFIIFVISALQKNYRIRHIP